jgi:hypothetical protein
LAVERHGCCCTWARRRRLARSEFPLDFPDRSRTLSTWEARRSGLNPERAASPEIRLQALAWRITGWPQRSTRHLLHLDQLHHSSTPRTPFDMASGSYAAYHA